MTNFVALPLVFAMVVAVLGSRPLDRLHPVAAARCCAILLAAVSIASAPTFWLLGLSGLAHAGFHDPIIDWSRHLLPDYPPVGAIVGLASLGAAVVGTVQVSRILIHHRQLRCTDTCPLELIDTDEVYAYTLPGPAATIAISSGLRDALDDAEFDIVVAHERAHARYRHDRYKLLALFATALLPPTRSIATRLDHYLERWADEEAVAHTGSDRRLAARTIAKVALAGSGSGPAPALGIAQHGVAARTTALLSPADRTSGVTLVQMAVVIAVTVLFSLAQLHHSLMFAADLLH